MYWHLPRPPTCRVHNGARYIELIMHSADDGGAHG
jgi:hypothetical protein